ncbi:10909_t:CDS:10 [Ambispora leptoticha]|uniref:10909_t:CDS:1 n=1 Tax=Ambispora leptoticha TaxID=144679 RepID=A0A9N9FYZ9_9GLOM|nr:10909_t:CDS:10 [Ambispora leptoticha]
MEYDDAISEDNENTLKGLDDRASFFLSQSRTRQSKRQSDGKHSLVSKSDTLKGTSGVIEIDSKYFSSNAQIEVFENNKKNPDVLANELERASKMLVSAQQIENNSIDSSQQIDKNFQKEREYNYEDENENSSFGQSEFSDPQQYILFLKEKYEKKMQEMATRIEELETEKDLAEEEKMAIEEDKFTTEAKVEQLERQVADLMRQLEEHHKETQFKLHASNEKIAELKEKTKELREENLILQQERDIFDEEKKELTNQLEELSNKINDLEGKNIKLRHTVEHLESRNTKLEAEMLEANDRATKKISSLMDEVGQLGEQLAMARGQGEEWIEEYQREQKRIESRLRDLGEQLRNAERQQLFLENQRNSRSSRRDELTLEIEKLSASVEDLSRNLERKNKELISLNSRYKTKKDELAQQHNKIHEDIKQIEDINEKLRDDLEVITKERDQLENQMETTETQANDLIKKVEELEEHKSNLTAQIEHLGAEIANIEDYRSYLQNPSSLNNELSDTRLLREEISRLRDENKKLSNDKKRLDDEKSRLEIHLTEMADMAQKSSDQSTENAQRNQDVTMLETVKEMEERMTEFENEIVGLRAERASLVAQLAAQENQISLLHNLRMALDHAKKQLLSRENEIQELKSRIELNELNMKSKTLHERLLDELNAKLDEAHVEIGKLRYQLTEAAQRAQDDIRDAKITELEFQKSELEKILRIREELLMKEQNKSRSRYFSNENTRGEIIEGISGLLSNTSNSVDKLTNLSFSHEITWLSAAEISFHGSTPARNNVKIKSLQPDFQSLKAQVDDLNQRLETKNIDLEKAISAGRGLTLTLEEAQKKMREMEDLMQDSEKSMVILQQELIRKQKYNEELEQQLKELKCLQQGGVIEMEGIDVQSNNIVSIHHNTKSNQSMTIEKELETTLQKNMQTVEYLGHLVKVVSQQNNFLRASNNKVDTTTSPIRGSDSMKNVQTLLEGLSQQASQMQKMMEDNGNILKRLASTALSDSSTKKQKRQSTRLSSISRNAPNLKQIDDTIEIKREDLQAIVQAGNDLFKHPAQFMSRIDNFASTVLDNEVRSIESRDLYQLIGELAPNLETTAKKIETLTGSLQKVLREFKRNSESVKENVAAHQSEKFNILITSVHELTANNMHLAMQMKQLASALIPSQRTDENSFIKIPSLVSNLLTDEPNDQNEVEKLRKLVATQSQLISDYEATIELFKRSEQDAQSLRAALSAITDIDLKGAENNNNQLQSQIQEFRNLWLQESDANKSLKLVMKEMKASANKEETKLRKEIELLTSQIANLSEKLQTFKLRAEKFEQKFREKEEALKNHTEIEKKLRQERDAMINGHARELETLKHHWDKERAMLTESTTKTKTQQLATIEGNHKELENTWKQEKETLTKKLRAQKESFERENKSLQKEIEKLNSKLKDFEIEIQSITANKRQLTLEKASLIKEKSELQQQLDNFYKESERYRKKNSSVAELENRMRRLQKEKDVNAERATQKIADLQKELQDTVDKVSKLTKEKSALTKDKSELNRKYMIADEMKDSLEAEVRANKEHMKALEVEIQNLTDQLQSERRDHQSKNEQLSRYEDELQAQERLREEVEQLQDTLSHERNQHQIQISKFESLLNQRRSTSDSSEEVKKLNCELSAANSRIKEIQESAHTAINSLEEEIKITKQQLVLIQRGQTNNHLRAQDSAIALIDKSEIQKFQLELNKERKRHAEERSLLIKEVRYQKAKWVRESGFRADLSYQKKFILLLLGGLESCAVTAIIAIQRMRILKNSWNQTRDLKRLTQQ